GGEANGEAQYKVYSDPNCEHLVAEAGKEPVVAGVAATSLPVGKQFEANARYYWQVTYFGDARNSKNVSTCGSEVMTFGAAPSPPTPTVSSVLSGGGQQGAELTVAPGTTITDQASVTAPGGLPVGGRVTYTYS